MSYKTTEKFKEVFNDISENLKDEKKKGIFATLMREIVKTGKCIKCGACSSVCDVLDWNIEKNQPKLIGKCDACGTCYYQCPAVVQSKKENFGNYLQIYSGKTRVTELIKPSVKSIQNGGITSSILNYLLKEENFDGAIVVQKDLEKPWIPIAKFITDPNDVFKSVGTVYAHAQTIQPMLEAILNKNAKKIAFVGTPCNIDSILTISEYQEGFIKRLPTTEIVKIGLFCMEAFIPDNLFSRLTTDGIDLSKITKMEISKNKFRLYSGKKQIKKYSIKELNDCVESSCHFCRDLTSENADISVGNIGTDDNLNSVIVRTDKGKNIIEKMLNKNYIELTPLSKDGIQKITSISNNKKTKQIPKEISVPKIQKDKFILNKVSDWANIDFGFTPEVNDEKYVRQEYRKITINSISDDSIGKSKLDEKPDVYIGKIPDVDGKDTIPYSYSSAYDLTINLLKDYDRIKGGKIFIKPNNTGFVGIFKTPVLNEILKKNGISDNADDQPIATQPSILRGMVDALLDLGANTIHIGENMLWDGGTPRAFHETGYTKVFSDQKYAGKVYFIDFYNNDPPAESLKRLGLESTDYCKVDYYNRCFPPKALFEEKYDLIYVASIAKAHNCSYYSLSVKNFSVTWNPRRKTGNIPPRWQIHGLPLNIFHKDNVKRALGDDFKRKYTYLAREVFKYPYKNEDYKERIVKKKSRKVIITNEYSSSGLMDTIKILNNYALDVDPHHWTGITMAIMNMGMGYLITRFHRIFSSVLHELKNYGTRVATLCTGIVGQERDGPLVYGNKKYSGFIAASFDHVALEKTLLDMMFSTDESGFQGFIVDYQKSLMEQYGIKDKHLIEDAESMWTLQLLRNLIGGEINNNKMNIHLLDYTKSNSFDKISATELYKLRRGAPYEYSTAFYVSPVTWLRALHSDDQLAMNAFIADKKSIEIPLIPGVVK